MVLVPNLEGLRSIPSEDTEDLLGSRWIFPLSLSGPQHRPVGVACSPLQGCFFQEEESTQAGVAGEPPDIWEVQHFQDEEDGGGGV